MTISKTTWTEKTTIAIRNDETRSSGVRNTIGRSAVPTVARSVAAAAPSPTHSRSDAVTVRRVPVESSRAASVATWRVVPSTTPRSANESQPVVAEKVCNSAQVPKAVAPRPLRKSGTETRATTMAHPLAAPLDSVLTTTCRRNGRGAVKCHPGPTDEGSSIGPASGSFLQGGGQRRGRHHHDREGPWSAVVARGASRGRRWSVAQPGRDRLLGMEPTSWSRRRCVPRRSSRAPGGGGQDLRAAARRSAW